MKLSVRERFMLLSILPPEGNFATLRIVRQLREALSFSEAEHEHFGIKEEQGLARWERSEDREYRFAARAKALIHDALQRLDEAGKLTVELLPLAEKFLGGESVLEEESVVERGGLAGPVPDEERTLSRHGGDLEPEAAMAAD